MREGVEIGRRVGVKIGSGYRGREGGGRRESGSGMPN